MNLRLFPIKPPYDPPFQLVNNDDVYIPDWAVIAFFAATGPEPTADDYKFELERDRLKNPHNDNHIAANKRRERDEIRAQLKFKQAEAMLAELKRRCP